MGRRPRHSGPGHAPAPRPASLRPPSASAQGSPDPTPTAPVPLRRLLRAERRRLLLPVRLPHVRVQ